MPTDWAALVQTGGVTALAIFALLILQKTWEGRLADQKTVATELAEQRKTLLEAMKANTAAMTDNAAAARESITASRELCGEVRTALVAVRRAKKVDV
jgi:hypothetical protein